MQKIKVAISHIIFLYFPQKKRAITPAFLFLFYEVFQSNHLLLCEIAPFASVYSFLGKRLLRLVILITAFTDMQKAMEMVVKKLELLEKGK